mmetsp:Transcript_9785/g.59542  ORF Transcript_9785/g.59542 Transcript_9785/m.59542 type:complete len:291 (-) Transcript_9785:1500-2372(-)
MDRRTTCGDGPKANAPSAIALEAAGNARRARLGGGRTSRVPGWHPPNSTQARHFSCAWTVRFLSFSSRQHHVVLPSTSIRRTISCNAVDVARFLCFSAAPGRNVHVESASSCDVLQVHGLHGPVPHRPRFVSISRLRLVRRRSRRRRHGDVRDAASRGVEGRVGRNDAYAHVVGAAVELGIGLRDGGRCGAVEAAADRCVGACEERARHQEGIRGDRSDGVRRHVLVRVAEAAPVQRVRRSRVLGRAIGCTLWTGVQVPKRGICAPKHGGGTVLGRVWCSGDRKVGQGVD